MAGMELPSDKRLLTRAALEIIEQCRVSVGIRASWYRFLNSIIDTGRQDGTRSMINLLHSEVDRLASHLFSPTDLRFDIEYDNDYPAEILERGKIAARYVTRGWQRNNTDMTFAQGVFEALKYGSCILKQWPEQQGENKLPVYRSSLVMPWQFGVYREDQTDLDQQSAMCETVTLSMPEVWRRIYHLPNADKLFERIKSNARKGEAGAEYDSYFHQILSTSVLNTSNVGNNRPVPGGLVQLNNQPGYSVLGPEIAVDMARMHEIWVQDGPDYTTIQLIEPDILIAPLFKKTNLLISGDVHSGLHPYSAIRPNETTGYFWGRTEIFDLIEPQGWLSETADDAKRLLGVQIDKILGITGDGIPEETYDQMRGAGLINAGAGATITDLTPKFPPELLEMLQMQMGLIDKISGFDNMLSGRGEAGVRSGVQSTQMMKTASPRLRDRSLLVERQCAAAADLFLSIAQAKDGRNHWTNPKDPEGSAFLLADLPEDRGVVVDSHSGSPIFADDHTQLIAFGLKGGFVDGHYAIDNLPFPNKDILHSRLKEKEEKQAALMKQLQEKDPEGFLRVIAGGKPHGHR